ncbi:spatacsin [Drosophila tropicalis]|uniref:spatacsin n=1 Tax=Drosophila tropicalis TaxID=46794 RepID=UPI0035AB7F31
MHSGQSQTHVQGKEKIFRSWSGISEITIIKEATTKGEHIDFCLEYWSQKRKIPLQEYRHYFFDVVQAYVQRLLSERLVCKAENVLRNVERDVKCFFYQYACECQDEELSEFVLDHLRSKEPQLYEQEEPVLTYYWSLVQQLRECSSLMTRHKVQIPRLNIEALMSLPEESLQLLLVELYFANGNDTLLVELNKELVWQHLVDNQLMDKLLKWLTCRQRAGAEVQEESVPSKLEQCFESWPIDASMYDYGVEQLKQPCEVLRNFFAKAGYFFDDESSNISTQLRRLCTMGCLQDKEHADWLCQQPLAKYLFERGYYRLLLMDCVPTVALEQLANSQSELGPLLALIVDLKKHPLNQTEGFQLIARSVQTYLEETHHGVEPLEEHPLLTFYDFLTQEPSIGLLEGFLTSTSLSRVPYLKSLSARFDHGPTGHPSGVPTPHELFRKFKNINLEAHSSELWSFSNARLSQRYARKSQLNYTHYIKQQRSAYAVYYLITEQLQLYGQITRAQLYHACETVTQLALRNAGDADLVTHCVACCEMLGFDTQLLRSFLLLQRQLNSKCQVENVSYSEMLCHWDEQIVKQLIDQPEEFPLELYQSLICLANRNGLDKFPNNLLKYYASRDDWWPLLLIFQYFDLPLSELKKLLGHFKTNSLGLHMLQALSYDCPPFSTTTSHHHHHHHHHKRNFRRTEQNTASSQETLTNSSQSSNQDAGNLSQGIREQSLACNNQDLFAILLTSSTNNLPDLEPIENIGKFMDMMHIQNPQCTWLNLLKNCVNYEMPILAVLATTLSEQNRDWCWLVWLAVTSGQWGTLVQDAHLSLKESNSSKLIWSLVRGAVYRGQVNALLHSFIIFQTDSKFTHLCRFLHLTSHKEDFSDSTIDELRQFFYYLSQDRVCLPLCPLQPRKLLMKSSINLLLTQLENNFDCILQQEKFLNCICRSDVGDICDLLDFCLLDKVFAVSAKWMRQFSIDLEQLVSRDSPEYRRLVENLTEVKAYEEALEVASMLQLPLNDIVYGKWLDELDRGELRPHVEYEREIEKHFLPPAILVNFLLQAANGTSGLKRYDLLKSCLSVIKQHHLFPNESFDRDQIEYDMTWSYLELAEDELPSIKIYYSEYFEQIMLKERCVLYKSFAELKELAGIDDLSIANKSKLTQEMENRLNELLNTLLDEGDIVEALRLQELFEFRPNDLRFIVFAMALAEGMTTVSTLAIKERQLLSEVEKSAFPKFNRITLNQRCASDLSDSLSDAVEFEEIPAKEKQQTLDTLLGICSKLKHGVELGRRIVLAYRAAMYLDKEYMDVLRTKDAAILLKSAAEEDCLQRLLVVSDIHISTRMTPLEIAESLALELTTCIVRPRFYILEVPRNTLRNANLWGHNIDRDFHLFLELAPNTTLLGNCLMDYCDALKSYRRYQDNKPYEESEAFERLSQIISRYGIPKSVNAGPQVLSHKKHNQIYVELLIKAHLCFVHECSMEGIANVLQRAKHLNSQLTKARSWSLIVRLLIGIARYREMYYCFDALIDNDQFESLLGQFDDDQKLGLRQAILSYLREYQPNNGKELLRLAALHFLMYKELAEMWAQDGQELITRIRQQYEQAGKLKCCSDVQSLLQRAMENFSHSTENYLLDNKLLLAQQNVAKAELMAMQLDLCSNHGDKRNSTNMNTSSTPICPSVLGVETREHFRDLVNTHLSVPQSLILSRAYGYDLNWSEALLCHFVILQRGNYLKEYLCHQVINDDIIEQAVKGYLLQSSQGAVLSRQQEEQSFGQLVNLIKSVTLKYKLASMLGLKTIVMSLINDSTVYYLRDTNFGRKEFSNIVDS